MKIIQANIWYGKFGQEIVDFLSSEAPDFVCMQEVNDLKGKAAGNFFATLDEIKDKASFAHAFMSPMYSYRYMEREMPYGNAILSRLPFTHTDTIFTRGAFMAGFDAMKNDSNIRNLQHATIDINGTALHILNHHGHHIHGSKAGDEETVRQMRIIAELVGSLDGPVILCGDFNLAPDSESIGIINGKLANLSIANGLKRTYTRFSQVQEVCDYIFVNDQVKVRRFEMPETIISDHKPLILEFDL
jgi:endonuclease/exonuclease/phosphatase family metal-dependent hydrolase